jgi:hypothetical protein
LLSLLGSFSKLRERFVNEAEAAGPGSGLGRFEVLHGSLFAARN